ALALALALREARRAGLEVGEAERAAALSALRLDADAPAMDRATWLAANHLDEVGLGELAANWARFARIEDMASVLGDRYLLDALRRSSRYGPLASRAARKMRLQAERGLEHSTASDLGLSPEELVRWYFDQRVGREAPQDMGRFVLAQGFADAATFLAALAREHLLWREEQGNLPGRLVWCP